MNVWIKKGVLLGVLMCAVKIWLSYGAMVELPEAAIEGMSEEIQEREFKQTQLLTIFLDNSEVYNGGWMAPITSGFLNAVYDKAGPIIASRSLLYNVFYGDYADKNRMISAEFRKWFNDGADWEIREIAEHLLIMVPRSYMVEKGKSLETMGLRIAQATPITIDTIAKWYPVGNALYWKDLQKKTGALFVEALLNHTIFDENNKQIEWVIYLSGHGEYKHTIATIDLRMFSRILDYCNFNARINVALFIYDSCYGAGLNSALVYGELTQSEETKEYSYSIVTQAVTDIRTGARLVEYSAHDQRLVYPLDFTAFFKTFMQDRQSYARALGYIMPDLRAYSKEGKEKPLYKGNIPLMRPAHTSVWIPVIEEQKSIIRITETMAMTRTDPLIIKHFMGADKQEKDVQAVLLDTNYIPFTVVIGKESKPAFIITLPGNVLVTLAHVIQENSVDITYFLESIGIELRKGSFYAGKKYIIIQNLSIKDQAGSMVIYTNVLVDFENQCFYYTDDSGHQWMMKEPSKQVVPARDYMTYFSGLFSGFQRTKEDQFVKLGKIHQVTRTVAQKAQKISGTKEGEQEKEAAQEYEEAGGHEEQGLSEERVAMATKRANSGLKQALFYNNVKEAIRFVREGAHNVNVRDQKGNSLLMYDIPLKQVRLLLDRGADVLVVNDEGKTVFSQPRDPRIEHLLKSALKREIQAFIDTIDMYKDMLSYYIEELQKISNQVDSLHRIDDELVVRINALKLYINNILELSPDAKEIMMRIPELIQQAQRTEGFPDTCLSAMKNKRNIFRKMLYTNPDCYLWPERRGGGWLLDLFNRVDNYIKINFERGQKKEPCK